MPKITPFLWFDHQAEEAALFYTSIFKNSKMGHVARYGDAGPGPKGSAMTASFEIEGQHVTALNGGPHYKLTPAFSFSVACDSQEEIDHYWDKLSAGGTVQQCGWLQDKFGLSWQIVPQAMGQLMSSGDPEKSKRVMQAMMKMIKLDIATLQAAYDGA